MTSVQPYLMIVNTCISITLYLDTVPMFLRNCDVLVYFQATTDSKFVANSHTCV